MFLHLAMILHTATILRMTTTACKTASLWMAMRMKRTMKDLILMQQAIFLRIRMFDPRSQTSKTKPYLNVEMDLNEKRIPSFARSLIGRALIFNTSSAIAPDQRFNPSNPFDDAHFFN
ncbi:hypothetical protein F5X99DRAFT_234719 [Biscogniauxia marginata]|nr:hypothetical protein F5X99DRAFT_234719 [Biscogniauxia marginata]